MSTTPHGQCAEIAKSGLEPRHFGGTVGWTYVPANIASCPHGYIYEVERTGQGTLRATGR